VIGASTDLASAGVEVRMSNPSSLALASSTHSILLFPAPVIVSVSPLFFVKVGSEIVISGNYFLQPCSLVFQSVSKFEVFQSSPSSNCSLDSCTLIAPHSSFNHSFQIYIQCSAGANNFPSRSDVFSSEFSFFPRPTILQLVPNIGFPGSSITVVGNGFVEQYVLVLSLSGIPIVVNTTSLGLTQLTFLVPYSISSLISSGRSFDLAISEIHSSSETGKKRNLLTLTQNAILSHSTPSPYRSCSAMMVQVYPTIFNIDPSVVYSNFPAVITLYGTNFIRDGTCQAFIINISSVHNSTYCRVISFQSVVVTFESNVAIYGYSNISIVFFNPFQNILFPILVSDAFPKLDHISISYNVKFGSIVTIAGTDFLTSRSCLVSTLSSTGWANISSECIVHSSSKLSFRMSYVQRESIFVVKVLRVSFSNTGFPGMSIELTSLPKYLCSSLHCTHVSADLHVLRIFSDESSISTILAPFSMTAGQESSLRLYSIDEFKVRRTSGGELFYVTPSSMSLSFDPIFASDNLDGSYSATIVPRHIGSCAVDALRLTAGYLLAEFFNGDPSWSSSSKVHIEMHNSIDFASRPTDFPFAAIRWTGFLRPNVDMPHTFFVYALGGIRIWLDHKIVLNHSDIPHSNGSAFVVNLSASRAHHLIVEYMRLETLASVQIKWSCNIEALAIIPSKHFYHGSHLEGSPFSVPTLPGAVSSFSALSDVVTLFTAGNTCKK